jgi:uncharacterized delta-60 repeat protein
MSRPGRFWKALSLAACMAGLLVSSSSLASASSESVTVTMDVPSATSINPAGCRPESTPSSLSFGTVLPGTPVVTSSDCIVSFGSSNDTSRLVLRQADGAGHALARSAWGERRDGFATNGRLVQDIAGTGQELRDVHVLPDGSIIAAGRHNNASNFDGLVMKVTPAGVLDTTFAGGAGYALLDLGGEENFGEWGGGLAIAPDGGIIVAGKVRVGLIYRGLLARFTATGQLDTAFGGGAGYVIVNRGSYQDRLNDVHVRSDGTIIATGDHHVVSTNGEMAAHAFRPDGTALTSWGSDGGWTRIAEPGAQTSWKSTLRDDGAVILAGADSPTTSYQVARLDRDGTLDETFGGSGIVKSRVSPVANGDTAYGVTIDDRGRVVAVGNANNGTNGDIGVLRLLPDGSPDTSFGPGGVRLIDSGAGDSSWAVMPAGEGGVLIAGRTNTATNSDMWLVQLRDDGSRDPQFGVGGSVVDSMATGNDWHYALAPGVDGEIVAAGLGVGATQDAIIDVYRATPVPNYVFGSTDWDQGAAMFGACLRAVTGAPTAGWPVAPSGTCAATDTVPWQGIATTASAGGATIATGTTPGTTYTVHLRFGVRTAGSAIRGTYRAPLIFETLAPSL